MGIAEEVQCELSSLGIEVGSVGSSSMILRTPGEVYDIGGIAERINGIAPGSVVDVQLAGGKFELVVSWPVGPPDVYGGGGSWVRAALGAVLGILGGVGSAMLARAYNVTVF